MSFQQIHTVLSIGLACEETHTRILNVCGDLPGKTFRVLKEKEIKQYGDAPQSQPVVGVGEVGESVR